MMKANKQIGFININEESIDKIIKDGEVVFEKGFLREKTSTTLPIDFNSIGKDLKDYKSYGNTVQNGTPTPDTPIAIVSCGDRTKNLWNSFNKEQTDNYKVSKDGTIQLINSSSTTNGYTNIGKSLKEMCPNLNVGDTVYLYIVSTWYRKEIYSSSIGSWTNGNSKTLTQQMLDSDIILYGGYQTTSTIKIMITKNQYYDTYEPYGYKIPINVRSENLLNTLNIPETTVGTITYKSENGLISLNGVSFNRNIELKTGLNEPLNGQYTVIFKKNSGNIINNSNVVNHRFALGNVENPNAGSPVGRLFSDIFNSTTDVVVATGTINDVLDKISIYINPGCTFDNYTFQIYLVKGTYTISNLPEYQPYYNETTNIYLDEPLRKNNDGTYKDYIDFKNKKIYRQIIEITLNGTESWSAYGANLYTLQTFFNNNPFIVGYGLSNLYRYNSIQSGIANGTVNGEFVLQKSNRNYNLFIKNTDIGSLENLKSDLSTKNMIINYPLETPTEESIALPNIPTVDGNNTLNIETEITPSQVYIKFKSNV